jgi:phosphatidylserine/phosphatidylglycerophosphate/cardiolipin synthase-like enzyme
VFLWDWDLGETIGDPRPVASAPWVSMAPEPRFPVRFTDAAGDTALLWPAFSPLGALPDSSTWDLPKLLDLLRMAQDSVHVTCLTYSPVSRDSTVWPVLDSALREAAGRGVRVRLLVSDWNMRPPGIRGLQDLEPLPGVDVRLVSVPPAAEGFIPYARVTHAKYMTVDGRWCWIGTGNWEESYFTKSRNVGMVLRSRGTAEALDRDFRRWWESGYAAPVDPAREYVPPRIGD